jgi:hypothetical protein
MSLLFVCAGKVIKKGGILKSAAFCILTRLTLLLLPFLADASNKISKKISTYFYNSLGLNIILSI